MGSDVDKIDDIIELLQEVKKLLKIVDKIVGEINDSSG